MKLIDEKLMLVSSTNEQVMGRISGNEDSQKIVILCHGFGVKSDSRGMYNHLSEELENDYLTVRFHFVKINTLNNTIYTPTFSEQLETLKTVVDGLKEKYPDKRILIVGHSQGCYIVSMLLNNLNYDIEKAVLLSPSIRDNIKNKIIEKFGKRENSQIDLNNISTVTRTDGSTTLIPSEFWEEAEQLDSRELFTNLSQKPNVYFVWPKGDSIEKPQEYDNLLSLNVKNYYELEGDHDFKTDQWVGLTKLLKEILK